MKSYNFNEKKHQNGFSQDLLSQKEYHRQAFSQLFFGIFTKVTFGGMALFQVPFPLHELHESQDRETAATSGAILPF